ncbi:unnamed protein product [Polarella glacialis]|uniref:Sodium/calcium exchanger membrane region domain-containing protein n=1 Tax=Polarella glacialis TaxID=89957 RepID=A0A813EVP5_POLGL|nr:unnamed protein product [Polarella glacialis]
MAAGSSAPESKRFVVVVVVVVVLLFCCCYFVVVCFLFSCCFAVVCCDLCFESRTLDTRRPEFFTALVATFLIVNEGGVGTIIGSAIFNILVIVGATGYIACKDRSLKIWWYPLTRDCAFYVISVAELAGFLSDDMVEWWEALIMIFTYFVYI